MMNHTFPVTLSILSAEALAAAVLPSYGLPPITDFRFLHFGLNHTYSLKVEGSAQYILRVYRAGWRTVADIAYEIDVLNHLHRQGVAVARPLPQQDGAFVHTLSAPEGPRYALLFTYAPGQAPAYETDSDLPAFHYGRSVAQLHLAMQDFTSQHARFPLDLEHLLTTPLQSMAPLLAHRTDDWRYLEQLADKIRTRLAHLPLAALEQGFCHGDLHSGNAHLTTDQVVTFFDFDCCGWGWRAYDLAVFRWGTRLRQQEVALWGPFLRGYQTERPLSELDVQAITWFVGIRHFWLLGLHTANGHDWGFGWMDDRYFDKALKFLRDWENEVWNQAASH